MARVTQPFRDEHAEMKTHLGAMSEMIGSLASATPGEQAGIARALIAALWQHIIPHAEWEEAVLYPAIDAQAGGRFPFTGAMRHEHGIIRRRLELLEDQSANPTHDRSLFARNADQLLGLILAHFEDEEEVLLPVLDATMSEEEFRRLIVSRHH